MNTPERSTMLTRRQALNGIAAIPVTVGVLPASATSDEDVDLRISELAEEIVDLLPHHPLQRIGSRGWHLEVSERGYWYSAQPVPDPHDPLVDAIQAYSEAMALFNRHELDDDDEIDAYEEVTYLPPLRALHAWDKPAISREGAIAALRFVVKESGNFWASDGVGAMVTAALGYLEAGRV